MSHARGVGLHHADHGVHTLRWNAQASAHAAHGGVGTGDEGIGALNQEGGEGSNHEFLGNIGGECMIGMMETCVYIYIYILYIYIYIYILHTYNENRI